MVDGDSPAGLADLERDGFLLVPGALDDEAVAWWRTRSTACTAAA